MLELSNGSCIYSSTIYVIGFAFGGLILLAATMLRRGDRGMFAAAVLVVVISGAGERTHFFRS